MFINYKIIDVTTETTAPVQRQHSSSRVHQQGWVGFYENPTSTSAKSQRELCTTSISWVELFLAKRFIVADQRLCLCLGIGDRARLFGSFYSTSSGNIGTTHMPFFLYFLFSSGNIGTTHMPTTPFFGVSVLAVKTCYYLPRIGGSFDVAHLPFGHALEVPPSRLRLQCRIPSGIHLIMRSWSSPELLRGQN